MSVAAAATLEGVAPTFTYYAGSSATGTPLSGAPVKAGTYTVIASFPGSADYTSAVSSPVTFTISPGAVASFVLGAPAHGHARRPLQPDPHGRDKFGHYGYQLHRPPA